MDALNKSIAKRMRYVYIVGEKRVRFSMKQTLYLFLFILKRGRRG